MSVSVEELYKFHKEELEFWNKHFPVKDLLIEVGFENVEAVNDDLITGSWQGEQIQVKRENGNWTFTMGVIKDNGSNGKESTITETGDLIDLGKRIYLPQYFIEGYQRELSSSRPIQENLSWYQEAMRIEGRNNLRDLIVQQEANPDFYKRKTSFIPKIDRKVFYDPRMEIFKEVKVHESNLVEGLTLRFGAKPYAPTITEALIQIDEIKEELTNDLKAFTSKFHLNDSALADMIAVAEKHAVPLMWQKDFSDRNEIEQGLFDAHKTKKDDLKF